MSKQRERGRKWDGRSRISNDKYKEGWNRIFNGTTKEIDRTTDEVRLRTGNKRRS